MLTDVALKNLKPNGKPYKVADRDGMYAHVSTAGAISFCYDYRMHGRRETLTLGYYGSSGLSLARAREKCIDARRTLADGRSPAQEKQRDKRRLREAKSFGGFGEKWLKNAPMADSTRAMRWAIFERELRPAWNKRLLTEILPNDLRALCAKIVERGAPATAIHVRDITKQILPNRSSALQSFMESGSPTRPTKSARPRWRRSFRATARCRQPRYACCSGCLNRCRRCRPSGWG